MGSSMDVGPPMDMGSPMESHQPWDPSVISGCPLSMETMFPGRGTPALAHVSVSWVGLNDSADGPPLWDPPSRPPETGSGLAEKGKATNKPVLIPVPTDSRSLMPPLPPVPR